MRSVSQIIGVLSVGWLIYQERAEENEGDEVRNGDITAALLGASVL